MAALPQELLDLLADPETHEALSLANSAQLAALQQALAAGTGRRRNGASVSADLDGALLSQGRRVAYLIEGGIPNLLIDERVELDTPL